MFIRKESIKGKIRNFPIEIVEVMVRNARVQTGEDELDVQPFVNCCSADSSDGGFDWCRSSEGRSFWEQVIGWKEFDYFYSQDNFKNLDRYLDFRTF